MIFKKKVSTPCLSDEDISTITALTKDITGLNINPREHGVIYQNVVHRMILCGKMCLKDYLSFANESSLEIQYLISSITIHTTGWFRESESFSAILEYIEKKPPLKRPLRALSIACSSGEEVYSLASLLSYLAFTHKLLDYAIDGWDIDPISLRTAREGVYPFLSLKNVTSKFRNFMKISPSKDEIFAMDNDIKSRCFFRTVNIFQPPADSTLPRNGFDIIFCRNLLIYFSAEQIKHVLEYCTKILASGGLLCLGASETAVMNTYTAEKVSNTVFKFSNNRPIELQQSTLMTTPGKASILILEDEKELLELIEDILKKSNFQVYGVQTPEEGFAILAERPIDLILSDINLGANISGIEFIEKAMKLGYKGEKLILSGIADKNTALKCIELGCYDVIQKPISIEELQKIINAFEKVRPLGS